MKKGKKLKHKKSQPSEVPSPQYPPYPQYPPPQYPPPQYPPYPYYPPPKKDNTMLIVIIVIIIIVFVIIIPVIAGILYVWTSGFEGSDEADFSVSISATVEDRTQYYKIDIVRVSGGTLSLNEAKFRSIMKSGSALLERTHTHADPSGLIWGDTIVYPIPSGSNPVNENATSGDGATVDSASISKPHVWENCYFAYLDIQSDGKVSAGDVIWIFKDFDDDNVDEITPGHKFKILDDYDNVVLEKEF